jgi:hypothetical protein
MSMESVGSSDRTQRQICFLHCEAEGRRRIRSRDRNACRDANGANHATADDGRVDAADLQIARRWRALRGRLGVRFDALGSSRAHLRFGQLNWIERSCGNRGLRRCEPCGEGLSGQLAPEHMPIGMAGATKPSDLERSRIVRMMHLRITVSANLTGLRQQMPALLMLRCQTLSPPLLQSRQAQACRRHIFFYRARFAPFAHKGSVALSTSRIARVVTRRAASTETGLDRFSDHQREARFFAPSQGFASALRRSGDIPDRSLILRTVWNGNRLSGLFPLRIRER